MTDVSFAQPMAKTDAEYEAMTDQLLKEIRALNALMDSSRENYWAETERLKTETRMLREEGLRLQANIQTALDRLIQTRR